MKIFIDIGHPAHVHYFRNFIKLMSQKGHKFFITARDKEVTQKLLELYKIDYISRGKGSNGVLGKLIYIFKADWFLYKNLKKYQPDILLSFASPYAAHASWLLKKPHICFDDTEHAGFNHQLYLPFTDVTMNPSCFNKDFGKKQIKFDSYAELFYLHPSIFKPTEKVLDDLAIKTNEKFVLLRFVSFKANHDIGQSGIDLETREKIIQLLLKNNFKVFISSEKNVPYDFLNKFVIKISPEKIHDVIAYADLLITEGATMASESAMLGTPAIYINSLDAGTLSEQEKKYELIHGFRNSNGVIEKVEELINTPDLKSIYAARREKLLNDKINITGFLIWFIENYPESFNIMKQNPDYQYKFK